jgi:rhodanese-related sulfurtransferase
MLPTPLLLLEPPPPWQQWVEAHPTAPGLIFAALCLLWLYLAARPRLGSWHRGRHRPVLDPLQLEELLLGPGALVLDLRDPVEFHRGHIRGSLNLTWDQLVTRYRAPDPTARRPIVLVDDTDEASHHAFDLLQSRGYGWLYVLKGGMRAWRRANRPEIKA